MPNTKNQSIGLPERLQGLFHVAPDVMEGSKPENLIKAKVETTKTVFRLMLTLLGFGLFCVLALASPDSSLLGGTASLNVPLAGPASFEVFLVVGPIILLGLRIYLHIYIQHLNCLEHIIDQKKNDQQSNINQHELPTISIGDLMSRQSARSCHVQSQYDGRLSLCCNRALSLWVKICIDWHKAAARAPDAQNGCNEKC